MKPPRIKYRTIEGVVRSWEFAFRDHVPLGSSEVTDPLEIERFAELIQRHFDTVSHLASMHPDDVELQKWKAKVDADRRIPGRTRLFKIEVTR